MPPTPIGSRMLKRPLSVRPMSGSPPGVATASVLGASLLIIDVPSFKRHPCLRAGPAAVHQTTSARHLRDHCWNTHRIRSDTGVSEQPRRATRPLARIDGPPFGGLRFEPTRARCPGGSPRWLKLPQLRRKPRRTVPSVQQRLLSLENELARLRRELVHLGGEHRLPGLFLTVEVAGTQVLLPSDAVQEVVRLVAISRCRRPAPCAGRLRLPGRVRHGGGPGAR